MCLLYGWTARSASTRLWSPHDDHETTPPGLPPTLAPRSQSTLTLTLTNSSTKKGQSGHAKKGPSQHAKEQSEQAKTGQSQRAKGQSQRDNKVGQS